MSATSNFQIAPALSTSWNTVGAVIVLVALGVWITNTVVHGLRNPLSKVPGPWHSRWTNIHLKLAVMSGRRVHYVHSLHQKYGPYVQIAPNEVSVNDFNGFNQIHRINSGFTKNVRSHAARRRMFARAFSKTYLRQNWENVVREKVQMAVARINSDATRDAADVLKWWTLMATDVSAHLMFGESFNMIDGGEVNDYVRIMQLALKGGGIGVELPFVREAFKFIPIKALQEMFRATNFLIDYAEIAVRNSKSVQGDKNIFATIIREAENGERLDDLDVRLEAIGLLVAGSDTTAITLTYLVWAILSNPKFQAELEAEDADIESLPFLNAVIEETLRLYGAAPGGLPRMVPVGGTQMNGCFFPEGTIVTTQSYSFHRDPTLFADPNEFRPARWLPKSPGTEETELSRIAYAVFSPFGAGSRVCAGIHLARMELRLATAVFFRECAGVRLAPSVTPESMELENFFLIAPVGHKCEVMLPKRE